MRILTYAAKSPERLVGARPLSELCFYRFHNTAQGRKVSVVQTQASGQLPDTLYRIQIRAVGRQVAQHELRLLLDAPVGVERRMVILGIIRDHHDPPPGAAAAVAQMAQKSPGALGIKAVRLALEEEFPVAQANGSEIADAFACGSMEYHRVSHLGRNPHPATGAVLLKMNFINCPQIHGGISCQHAKFFYARLVRAGRLEQLRAGACAAESPTVETVAGTGVPLGPPQTVPAGSARGFYHPKRRRLLRQPRSAFGAGRFPLGPVARSLTVKAGLGVRRRSIRPSRGFRTDAPNSPRCEVRRLA